VKAVINNYKKSFKLILKNKILIMLLLIYNLVAFPMKQFPIVTGIAYFFIALFFTAGILGIVQNIDNIEHIKFKTLMKQGGKHFSYIIISLWSVLWIAGIDFLLMLVSAIIPMYIAQVTPNWNYSLQMLGIIVAIVFIYRVALFITAFFPIMLNNKDYGNYAVIKQKEVLWRNKGFWLMLVIQAIFYLIILVFVMWVKNIIPGVTKLYIDFILNFVLSFIAMFFFITDFYIYKEIIEKTVELQGRLEENSYDGAFKTMAGKYLM
jgi:hypothetical protein